MTKHEKKAYFVQQRGWVLGDLLEAGAEVTMTEAEAKNLLLAGNIAAEMPGQNAEALPASGRKGE